VHKECDRLEQIPILETILCAGYLLCTLKLKRRSVSQLHSVRLPLATDTSSRSSSCQQLQQLEQQWWRQRGVEMLGDGRRGARQVAHSSGDRLTQHGWCTHESNLQAEPATHRVDRPVALRHGPRWRHADRLALLHQPARRHGPLYVTCLNRRKKALESTVSPAIVSTGRSRNAEQRCATDRVPRVRRRCRTFVRSS